MSKYKVDISGINTGSLTVLKSHEMKKLLALYRQNHDQKSKRNNYS